MKLERLRPAMKWGLYSGLLLLLYALQTTPGLFSIFGTKPVLVLGLAVAVSMYEGVLPSAFFCMTTGFLWDISSDKVFGFNAVILLVCGLFISLLCIYYLHTRLLNALLFCAVTLCLQGLLDYVFDYALWNLEGAWIVLVHNILPTAAYTLAVMPLFYFLVRTIERRFSMAARV